MVSLLVSVSGSLAIVGRVTIASLFAFSLNYWALWVPIESFASESSDIFVFRENYKFRSVYVSQLAGYGDSPKCAREKLALVQEISSRNLWFALSQGKEESKYNPYPGSYFFVVRMLPSRGEWNYPLSSEETSKVYGFMRARAKSLSTSIIKSCPNISSVHFPIPHTGTPNALYRHDVDTVMPFQCLGQIAPSGWGFGPCT
jgi:hypothetical protein